MGYVYVGESAGGRVIRYGQGFAQVGAAYQLVVGMWPMRPAGLRGEVYFRRVTALVRHTLGYDIRITPIVDGIALSSRSFSGGTPSGGRTEEIVECSAPVFHRGASVEAIIETLSLSGETEIVDVAVSRIIIRQEE